MVVSPPRTRQGMQQRSASSFRTILLYLAFSPCQLKNARSVVEWSIHYPTAAAAADCFAWRYATRALVDHAYLCLSRNEIAQNFARGELEHNSS